MAGSLHDIREHITSAQLCLDGPGGFEYVVATVRYILREDETFRYELIPNYDVIDLLESPDYQGIPGFDLSSEKALYERNNLTPTLIADRAPMQNREDLWELLAACGMDYWDPLEWLIRTNKRYAGDRFYFRRADDVQEQKTLEVKTTIAHAPSTLQAIKRVLTAICAGTELWCDGERIDRAGRRALHRTLLPVFEKMERSKSKSTAKGGPHAVGRRRKPIDELMLREVTELYRARKITAKEAARRLGVGESTFYRRMPKQ